MILFNKITFFFLSIALFNNVNAEEETKIMVSEKTISSADSIDSLLQVSIGLAIVLAAIFALAWFVKRVVKVNAGVVFYQWGNEKK